MGKGIDLCRQDAPEHTALLDDFKDQLLIALVRRLNCKVSIPVAEVDQTGDFVLSFSIRNHTFHFELRQKQ